MKRQRSKSRPQAERVTGVVWGLDLGRRTGWAFGTPGQPPQSGAWDFDGDIGDVAAGLMRKLQAAWLVQRPELVASESPLPLAAFKRLDSSEANVEMHFGLRVVVRGLVAMWPGMRYEPANNATVRKHFIGRANLGERELTKAAVVHRCQVMGLVARDCFDDDRCDAISVHDWAAYTFGQRAASINELYLTGEKLR